MRNKKFILWFREITLRDVPRVGGKNASLGEMYQNLGKKGITVPNGFAITAHAYRTFIKESGKAKELNTLLRSLKKNKNRLSTLQKTGKNIRTLIRNAKLPKELEDDILTAYQAFPRQRTTKALAVAVRSSATAEDLPTASFAGQQETYLNIRGKEALLRACKNCFASLFTDRAIAYRAEHGFAHNKVYLSIAVQEMIASESSGVMFTLDTESGFRNTVLINSAYGLGENIVQGIVNPDRFTIFKGTLKTHNSIISRRRGSKKLRMIYGKGKEAVKNVSVSKKEQEEYSITDKEALTLARWGVLIENYYSQERGVPTPMDIEWAKDKKKLYILQARPETVHSQKKQNILEQYVLQKRSPVLVRGQSVGSAIGYGKARVITNTKGIRSFKKGEVLITDMTDPDWVPIMKQASAIVTNRGGRTCHAAIVSRELGIPCIVGTTNATKKLRTGQHVTVNCSEGDSGFVHKGDLPYTIKKTVLRKIPDTRTQIMLNIGDPTEAFRHAVLPVKGAGLVRQEFIITNTIKIHPLALIHYQNLPAKERREIDTLTKDYKKKKDYFIDKLVEGIASIGAALHPHSVIVRFSDFKSNEYRELIGGSHYEPQEDNPMIGWRGASRYYDKNYKKAFALECEAIKKVREDKGLRNVHVMIPFCRTPEEGKKVLHIMKKNGLSRGKKGLHVYVMAEVPSNIILAEEFCKDFDGFSIGSNDLTQLTLAVDRDSEKLSELFNERHEAVLRMIEQLIYVAKKHKKKVGICGQAPSDYPDFTRFLVRAGIDSISLNADSVMKTLFVVKKAEQRRR